ncbi:hypothetical protein ACTXHN_21950 [Bacillus licheniformis]|uniref:hypothetical protein n=1 Tax=Bacillus licheniformis TaxID=1402 RepID=UPI004045E584
MDFDKVPQFLTNVYEHKGTDEIDMEIIKNLCFHHFQMGKNEVRISDISRMMMKGHKREAIKKQRDFFAVRQRLFKLQKYGFVELLKGYKVRIILT